MLVKKLVPPSSFKAIDEYTTVYIWCSDGWMYDRGIRRKYSFSDGNILIEEEATERAVYSDVQQIEKIHIFILSMSPKIWIEKGDAFEEMYVEIK